MPTGSDARIACFRRVPRYLAFLMPASPSHIVRRADGTEAGALYDLPYQRKVALQVEDPELADLLVRHGVAPPRPPLLDAAGHGVQGAYATRPQRNWFLAPPLESVVKELDAILSPAGYSVIPIG